MLKDISIKNKLIGIIFFSLIGLASILAYVVTIKSQETQIKDKFDQLETIEFTKHAELKKYFSTLKNILTITAQNTQTVTAFDSFKVSFHNIKNEINFYKDDLEKELILDYDINYISKINFNIPGVKEKLQTSYYVPKSLNAMIAQKVFILDNPAKVGDKNIMIDNIKYNLTYVNNHRLFHPIYNNLLKTFNLYDIFMIDLEGNVVYSTFKEKDFATNLITGPYSDSGLARVFKKAKFLKPNEIAFEDFTPYEPSYNVSASFISAPIFSNNKIVGVLAFQLPSAELTNIMQFDKKYKKAGLGQTGEAYLVGSDYKMRTNSRFLYKLKNDNIKQFHTTIGLKEVRSESVKAVMNGDKARSYHIIKNEHNVELLSVYHLVHPFDKQDVKWAIIAEINKDEVLKPIDKIIEFMLYTTTILVLLFWIISLSLIRNIINKPLTNFQHSLQHFFMFLKGKEKETKFLEIKSNDEIGKMSKFVNEGIKDIQTSLEKEKKERWIKEGIRGLNQIYLETTSTNVITNNTLEYLHSYIKKLVVGVIYIYDEKNKLLIQNGTFAYTNTEYTKKEYKLNEGIVGEVGYIKKEIILEHTNNSTTDLIIQTSIKTDLPKNTYTFALTYNDVLYGVIEFGTLISLDDKEIEFVKASTKTIAIAISTAQKNNEVKQLLDEANKINKNLNAKQKEIEEANLKMQKQQLQLEISNANLEEQQLQLEEANASMEEQQQKLEIQNKELNLAQKEVEQKAKDLEQSNKYKTEFMANMSHELRTPLNAVILLSDLMSRNKKQNLSDDDVRKATTINTAGKDLLRLIDDILDLSKVEAGKIDIIIDQFKPIELLEELKNLYEQSAINKNIHFNIQDNYHEVIKSDKHRISQILKNLISNALKFTTEGSIDISISKNDDKNLPIKISVKDTGIGIPKDKLNKIFEAFTQADGSTSRQYGGTGLGLSITKELTHLLGGTVHVDSKENEGSIFTILLPNLEENNNEIVSIKEEDTIEINEEFNNNEIENLYQQGNFTQESEDTIIDDINLADLNVLVVDDDIKNIFVLDGVLQDYNANVYTAYNGEEAIELLNQNNNIDIILMDIMMPVMDGFEAIKIIRETKEIKHIPIIAVTAKTLQEDKDKCLEVGANDYVSKPINMKSLINIIKVWYEKS
jgi:signal transduction histidine kinase